MTELTLLYISLSGNTNSFVKRFKEKLENKNIKTNLINVYDLKKEEKQINKINNKFLVLVPTYLEGGNGIDTGTTEILTTPLRDFIRNIKSNQSLDNLIGIVGSGNKNFNKQYCLTAKQYAEEFNKPFIFDFEMRGTENDLNSLLNIVTNLLQDD